MTDWQPIETAPITDLGDPADGHGPYWLNRYYRTIGQIEQACTRVRPIKPMLMERASNVAIFAAMRDAARRAQA